MQRKENNALPFSYRLLGVALFALCLLLLLWVAGRPPRFRHGLLPHAERVRHGRRERARHAPHGRGGSCRPL